MACNFRDMEIAKRTILVSLENPVELPHFMYEEKEVLGDVTA